MKENACQHAFEISTCMSIKFSCQHTKEGMSTCIRNFHMHINKNFMSTYKKIHVNIQKNACPRKIACQHTASFPDEKVLDLDAPALQPLVLVLLQQTQLLRLELERSQLPPRRVYPNGYIAVGYLLFVQEQFDCGCICIV
jgi:hypothetical protein